MKHEIDFEAELENIRRSGQEWHEQQRRDQEEAQRRKQKRKQEHARLRSVGREFARNPDGKQPDEWIDGQGRHHYGDEYIKKLRRESRLEVLFMVGFFGGMILLMALIDFVIRGPNGAGW